MKTYTRWRCTDTTSLALALANLRAKEPITTAAAIRHTWKNPSIPLKTKMAEIERACYLKHFVRIGHGRYGLPVYALNEPGPHSLNVIIHGQYLQTGTIASFNYREDK